MYLPCLGMVVEGGLNVDTAEVEEEVEAIWASENGPVRCTE